MTEKPFDPDRLPGDLRALLSANERADFETALEARIQVGEREPELVVAYAWAFHVNSEAMLRWEESSFDRACQAVVEMLDFAQGSPELSNPDGARQLFRALVRAMKLAPQMRAG